jgi:hypothetical protein
MKRLITSLFLATATLAQAGVIEDHKFGDLNLRSKSDNAR